MAVRYWHAVLLCIAVAPAIAENAADHLARSADAYTRLQSLQVEAVCERRTTDGRISATAVVKLYSSPPDKVRIESIGANKVLQSVLISNGKHVTEYRGWNKEFTRLPAAGLSVRFSPGRGIGLGEMSYETVAEGVAKASIRGRQTLHIGADAIRCIVVEVEYAGELSKYAFWIAEESGLILRRLVTFWSGKDAESLVSTVRALTTNEKISDSAFEFNQPSGTKEVSAGDVAFWFRSGK